MTLENSKRSAAVGLALLSSVAITFIGKWEGNEVYTAYADKLANGLPTVCKGLTKHITFTPIIIGDVWTKEQCETEERAALFKVQRDLLKCFNDQPPQSVFDAATSHAWNMGSANTCSSNAMKLWNQKLYATGCRALYVDDSGKPVWSYVKTGRVINGKPEYKFVQGLANRRQDEFNLCMRDL